MSNDVLIELQRPFEPNSVKWKVTATWPKDSPRNGLVVPFVDARVVAARLDHVCGLDWSTRIERDPSDPGVALCYLTVNGTTRADLGKGSGLEKEKASVSDSVKRAAVTFGVGRFLYSMQAVTLGASANGELDSNGQPTLRIKTSGNKKSLVLTPQVEEWLKEKYGAWLKSDRNRWGEPISHGDEADALGDPVERDTVPTEQEDLELAAAKTEAEKAYGAMNGSKAKLPKGRFTAQLNAASTVEDVQKLVEKIKAAK